ncbi:MAG: hypothetical protein WBM11_06430 [Terriglobales bacterium]
MKIEQVKAQLAQKLDDPLKNILQDLEYLVPDNYRSRVFLLDAKGRKKPSNASAENWSPESGRIEIRFEAVRVAQKQEGAGETRIPEAASNAPQSAAHLSGDAHPAAPDLLQILVRALDHAESTPGWSFVSLKKFRDEVLPSEPFPPGAFQPTDVHWQEAIRRAIERKMILVGRVPNPKSPQFPVTSVRLNRLMPEVKALLGHGETADMDFHPVEIKGEPLSATIIRERHR